MLGLSACSSSSGEEAGPGRSSEEPAAKSETEKPDKQPDKKQDKPEGPLRVAFLGDSYVDGEGAKRPQETRWTARVSERLGWTEVNLGLGGTGYTTPGPKEKATTYFQRVDAVKEADPDVVVVSGGRNDVLSTPERIRAAAAKLLIALEQLKGSPLVVVVEPMWDASTPPRNFREVVGAVRAAALGAEVEFVSVPRQPLLGRPKLIARDKLHPTDAGYAVIARILAPRLKAAVDDG